MSGPESSPVVRQPRHDVDDVYELLSTVAETQRGHTTDLGEIQQVLQQQVGRLDRLDGRLDGIGGRLDGIDGRLDGIDDTQRQILELLRGRQEGAADR
ncbi:MAG: hypothetical protein M3R63_08870 [Actinomycetota bacterium]|nr:hypothetical protein [Actinomycetota bacterium]